MPGRPRLKGGQHPIARPRDGPYLVPMKTHLKKKVLTFGDFVAAVYDGCGQRKARNMVRQAVNEHLVVFRGKNRFQVV